MDEFIPIIAIVSLFLVLPAMFFHYVTKWKEMKTMSADDEASFADLHKTADRLEDRLRTLERILEDEVPNWRSRTHDDQ
ncbi:envelope stress response membrane protein PspB [Yunchengibacter salinarum]|uniref:envelope stress response membrane protein PspB n=1 Tax=Yunchengibacter salinarum TaxID=3133399 RepID=UPI0035B5FABA